MPIPFKPIDFSDAKQFVESLDKDELRRATEESITRGEAEINAWLAQYDTTGHLKPEFILDPDRIELRSPDLREMRISDDERAARIAKLKHERGVL